MDLWFGLYAGVKFLAFSFRFAAAALALKRKLSLPVSNDVAMVRQAMKQRRRHFRIAEHAGPFAEAQVRGDDHAGALVKLAKQMEEQGAASGLKGR